MKTLDEVLLEMKTKHGSRLVKEWREMIPEGSRWNPGDPGDPECKECDGVGYLRLEGLNISNPNFGKLVLCRCVKFKPMTAATNDYTNQ